MRGGKETQKISPSLAGRTIMGTTCKHATRDRLQEREGEARRQGDFLLVDVEKGMNTRRCTSTSRNLCQ